MHVHTACVQVDSVLSVDSKQRFRVRHPLNETTYAIIIRMKRTRFRAEKNRIKIAQYLSSHTYRLDQMSSQIESGKYEEKMWSFTHRWVFYSIVATVGKPIRKKQKIHSFIHACSSSFEKNSTRLFFLCQNKILRLDHLLRTLDPDSCPFRWFHVVIHIPVGADAADAPSTHVDHSILIV